jgi:hypothetical protein
VLFASVDSQEVDQLDVVALLGVVDEVAVESRGGEDKQLRRLGGRTLVGHEATDPFEALQIGESPLGGGVLGLAETEDDYGAALISAEGNDVYLVLCSPCGVVDHGGPDGGCSAADGFIGCEPERELAGNLFEVRPEHVSGKSKLCVSPRIERPTFLEPSEVASGDDVVEANNGIGKAVDRPAGAKGVIGAPHEASLFERGERVLHRSLLATECGCDGRLAGVALGDGGDNRVIERMIDRRKS